MTVRQYRKNIKAKEIEAFNIICTPYGSLVKTYQILNGIDIDDAKFVKLMKRDGYPFLDDKDFIKKTLENVGYEYINIVNKPVAVCSNENNTIFCPFIFGNNEVVLLPLFKDRTMLHSQEIAMANDSYQIVNWSNIEGELDNE